MMISFLIFCFSRPFFRESETKKGCDTLYTSERKRRVPTMKKAIPGITANLTPGRPLNCGMHETVQDGQAYRTRSGCAAACPFFGDRHRCHRVVSIPNL